MSDKHYHNDYKKLIGLDESRTASEKLLDRAIKKREQPSTIIKVENQTKKKVKRQHEDKQVIAQQTITKLLKVLSNKNMIAKVQKCYDILNKCLQEKPFVDQLKEEKIIETASALAQNQIVPQGTLNQLIQLCEAQGKTLQKLSAIIEQKYAQKYKDVLKKMQLLNGFMQIITDDSFSFNKQLSSLKKILFEFYQKKKTSQAEIVEKNTQLQTYIEENILHRLLSVPNAHLEWAKTGITNLFKQLIAEYKDNLMNSKRVLEQYNKFLSEKKSNAHSTGSYDIMGANKTNGATYSVVEQFDSANAWCKRQ